MNTAQLKVAKLAEREEEMSKGKRTLGWGISGPVAAAVIVAIAGLLTFYDSPRVLGQGDVSPKTATSSNAYLGNLNLSGIELEHDSIFVPPGFSALIFSYTVGVPNSLTQTTVTPTPAHSAATYVIKLGSVTDADGVVELSVGSNVITVEVTAEDRVTKMTYTVAVNRAPPPSTDATLSGLTLSGIDIGSFSSSKTSYTASVYNSVSQTTVTPTLNQSGASYVIKLGTSEDADGTVSLAVGSNVITVEVTAEDGQTTKTYKATVNRASASAPTTGELSTDSPPVNFRNVSIDHDSAIYSFNFPRNRGIFGWVIQRYEHDGSTFVSSGPDMRSEHSGTRDLGGEGFKVGDTNVEADVLYKWVLMLTNSQGSAVIESSVTVRSPSLSSDPSLSDLTLSGIDIGTFASYATSYSSSVANSVSQTTVTPTLNHSGASYVIKLGGVTDDDGTVSLAVGSNVITIEVTAEDGQTTRTYTVTVTRAAAVTASSTDATLSALALSGVDFGTFVPGTTSYSASVANGVTQTTVTPTVNHSGASHAIKLGGVTDADGVIDLSVGSNVITIEVTAEDDLTTRTYTVTVTRAAPSTDATLRWLALSGIDVGNGVGHRTYTQRQSSFGASVYHSVSQTTVTAASTHSSASFVIKLGGVTDADGAISLAVGSNVITIEVTAEDGQTTKTYTATIRRASASAPTTGQLSTDDPRVNFHTVQYSHRSVTLSVSYPMNRGITGVVTQRYKHDGSSFVSAGADGRYQESFDEDLGGLSLSWSYTEPEPDTLYKWVVKMLNSQNSTVIETSLEVRIPPDPRTATTSSDATLSNLTLSGLVIEAQDRTFVSSGFHSIVTNYVGSVANSVTETTVTPTVNHSGASYVIKLGGVTDSDGTVSLAVGSNVITVEVTAEDGDTTRTYTVTVTRATSVTASSTDATLSGLTLSGINFGTFAPGTTSYTASVANSVTQTTVTPTVNHSGAGYVIKLGGVTDADGTVPLSVGSNVITVEVTAEDDSTTRTYTVTVTRAESSNPMQLSNDAALSSLSLSGIDFGVFDSTTASYTATVANSVTQTTVTPTVSNSGASYVIKLGGVTDADGTVSLSEGSNVITVEVTAEDTTTTQTYTVTVTREGLPAEETEEEMEQRMMAQYDANEDEVIDLEEAILAVRDYFNGTITVDEAIVVVRLFFSN